MTADLAQLRDSLRELNRRRGDLALRLDRAAEQLDRDGIPPGIELLEDLRHHQDQESSFNTRLSRLFPEQTFSTSAELEEAITFREQSLESRATIVRFLSLRIENGDPLPELTREQHRARTLLNLLGLEQHSQHHLSESSRLTALTTLDRPVGDIVEDLRSGAHPWCALLQLVEQGDQLSDSQWSATEEQVASQLGRPIAVAAARGRLIADKATPPASTFAPDVSPSRLTITQPKYIPEPTVTSPPPENKRPDPKPAPVQPVNNHIDSITLPKVDADIKPAIESEQLDDSSIFEDVDIEQSERAALARLDRDQVIGNSSVDNEKDAFPQFDFSSLDLSPAETIERLSQVIQESEGVPAPDKARQVNVENLLPVWQDLAKPTNQVGLSDAKSSSLTKTEQQEFEAPDANLKKMAEQALAKNPKQAGQLIARLIWQLIFEGRAGLAWHLSRALEEQQSTATFVPSWLVSCWSIGLWVIYPKGHLASQMRDDLTNYRQGDWNGNSRKNGTVELSPSDHELAMSLLLRGAVLRGAVICPSTRAATILRTFPLQNRLSRLYNYCTRVAACGENLNGLFPANLKDGMNDEAIQSQLATLRDEIRQWRAESKSWSARFETTQPLFQRGHWSLRPLGSQTHPERAALWPKWMQTLRMADDILAPVLAEDVSKLSNVRSKVDRLNNRVAVGDEQDLKPGDDLIVVPIPAMQRHLHAAGGFAHRWLMLHGRTAGADRFLPQTTVSLIDEVNQRHEPLLEELQQFVSMHPTPEVRIAAACLMLSMQQLRDLLDPRTPAPLHEPQLRHLLHSDMLRLQNIPLDRDWLPELPADELAEQLLQSLTMPVPNWEKAFELQSKQGNHEATERLLQLQVWSDEKRTKLTAARRQALTSTRDTIAAQLEEAETRLSAATSDHVVSQTKCNDLKKSLSLMKSRLERTTNISVLRPDVDHLLKQVETELPTHWCKQYEARLQAAAEEEENNLYAPDEVSLFSDF